VSSQLLGEPFGPRRARSIVQHFEACRRPVDDVTAGPACIDALGNEADRAFDAVGVTVEQVDAATTCSMRASWRQLAPMLAPPLVRLAVLPIDVQHREVGHEPGRDSDQPTGVIAPQTTKPLSRLHRRSPA
jgi:hypothetical protein